MKKIVICSLLALGSCADETNIHLEKELDQYMSQTEESNNGTPVNCNEFEIKFDKVNENVKPVLKTDLPDEFLVNISISRSYFEKESEYASEYPLDYYNETKTVGEWKEGQWITINDQEWINNLILRQEEGEQMDMPFKIDRISDSIGLSGTIFSKKEEYKLINSTQYNSEISFKSKLVLPIKKLTTATKVPIRYNKLKIASKYVVSEKIPLMPSLNPNDPIAAIEQMKDVFPNEIIKIIQRKDKGNPNNPWYQVVILDSENNSIKKGWINSIALMGKEVTEF